MDVDHDSALLQADWQSSQRAGLDVRVATIKQVDLDVIFDRGDEKDMQADDDHDAGAIRYTNSTNKMQFDTNGVPNQMVITSAGDVGIGIADPGVALDVSGAVQATSGFKTAGHPIATYASFTDLSGGSYATRLGSTGTSTLRSTQIYGGGGHIATFDGVNTRLGINVTAPGDRIEIRTTAHGQGLTIKSTGNTSNAVTFDANRGTGGVIGSVYGRWNGTTVAQMSFVSGNDGTDKNDGYITFGTESAASNGNVNATERLRIKSNGQIVLGSDGSNSELTFSQDGSTGVILNSTTTGFGGYNTFTVNSAQFVHKYGGNERLRIDSSGRVGVNQSSFATSDTMFSVSETSGHCEIGIISSVKR